MPERAEDESVFLRGRRRTALNRAGTIGAVVLVVLFLPRLLTTGDAGSPRTVSAPTASPTSSAPAPVRTEQRLPVPISGRVPPTAVWYDDAGLHHGTTVVPLAIDTLPVSLTLVTDGVLYAEQGTLAVWYQPWSGEPRRVGSATKEGSRLFVGPGSDARGATAAWFDVDDLVMFDTGKGVEIARKPQPGRRPTLNYQNAMGSRIDYVDPDRVVWTTRTGGVYSFDRGSGSVTELSQEARHGSYLVDFFPGFRALNANDERWPEALLTGSDGRLVYHGGVGYDSVRFSPDGRYLVVIDEPAVTGLSGPVVVDTRTGRGVVPVRSRTYPWIGWSYGHTLMYLQQGEYDRHWGRGDLLAYDAATHQVRALESHGDVVLPAN